MSQMCRMANSADPGKVASSGSGSKLFVQACLSQYLGSYRNAVLNT